MSNRNTADNHQWVGRRRLLKSTGVLGTSILAGCSMGNSQGENPTANGNEAQNGTAKSGSTATPPSQNQMGGSLRVSVQRNPATVNPLKQGNLPEYMFTSWTYSNLTEVNRELEVKPQLATDWEKNKDATQWTFNLNPDATFHHNGAQVTASDVAATFRKSQDPDVGSVAKGSLGPIDSFESVDKTTFRINLKEPFVSTPQQVAIPQFRILPEEIVTSQEKFEQTTSKEYGSGPFVQESYQSGNKISVSRYEDYFQTDKNGNQLPYLDKIVQKSYPESSTEMSALGNKQLDVVPEVSSDLWSRAKGMNVETLRRAGTSWPNVVMRCDTAPFNDPKVRKALRVAVDRPAIVEGALNGLGTVSQDNMIPPSFSAHIELDKLGPDREQAKQLLAEAGYPDGLDLTSDQFDADLTLYAANSPTVRTPLAVQLQEQLKSINVKFEIQQINYDNFLSNIWTKAPFYIGFYVTRIVPVTTYNLLLVSDASWNETQWNNKKFDEAVRKAQAATEEKEQREHLKTCQRLLYEEGPYILPFFMDELGAHRNYVKNFYMDISSSYPTAHTWETYLTENAPTKQ